MQTRETFGEILSRNHRFFWLDIRLVTRYHCIYLISLTFLVNKSIVFQIPRLLITNNRFALLGPIMCEIIKASAKQNFKSFPFRWMLRVKITNKNNKTQITDPKLFIS